LGSETGPAADQFAFATVIYELFASQPAFGASNLDVLLYQVVHEEPERLDALVPNLPPRVVTAVHKALAKDPGERYPSVREFVNAVLGDDSSVPLGAALPLKQTEALPASADVVIPTQLLGKAQRNPPVAPTRHFLHLWGLGTVGLLCLVLAATFWSSSRDRSAAQISVKIASEPPPAAVVLPDTQPLSTGSRALSVTVDDEEGAVLPQRPSATEALEKLLDAEKLFATRDYREGLRVARQSVAVADSLRARALVFLCHCGLADLGNARASLFAVPNRERKELLRQCQTLGLEL